MPDYRAAARSRLAARRLAYRRATGRPLASRSIAGKSYKSRYMSKTTKKGAYKPAKKANFQKRRAPFVETKHQTDEILAGKNQDLTGNPKDGIRNPVVPLELSNGNTIDGAEELNMLPVQTFLSMNKGLESSDMIGASLYSRYLQARLEFELPSGQQAIKHPCNLYLVHGWITAPKNNTQHTDTDILDQTRVDLQQYIRDHVEEHFNQRRDKLQWIPKRTSTLKILGYRKIKPKPLNNLGADTIFLNNPNAGGIQTYTQGSKPLINMVCNWTTKRKVHYVQGQYDNMASPPAVEHFYPNYAWLPFMLVFNPTAGDFLNTTLYPIEPKIKVRYNCIHYFSDS